MVVTLPNAATYDVTSKGMKPWASIYRYSQKPIFNRIVFGEVVFPLLLKDLMDKQEKGCRAGVELRTMHHVKARHLWGELGREQHFCTYNGKISQRITRIEYDALPGSSRDTMCITRAVGVSYLLYIDSLSVVQENPGQWNGAAESSLQVTEEVFSNAYYTMAASSAPSLLVGTERVSNNGDGALAQYQAGMSYSF